MTRNLRSSQCLSAIAAGFLIGDGGYGALLRAQGMGPDERPDLWNITHPERVLALHRAFIEAGSQLIQTNTFQANRISFSRHGAEDELRDAIIQGVRLAREAAGETVFVAGSMGPTGALVEPYGDLPVAQARRAFDEQAQLLAESGVDLVIVETHFCLEEVTEAVEAVKNTGLPVAASMTFEARGSTAFGVDPATAAVKLEDLGADLTGANCSTGPAEMLPVIERMRQATRLPLLAQPNAGLPQVREGKVFYPETPQTMAEYAVRFRDLGVALIGACCGAGPEHIAAMARALRA
jgi:5-methyltetrahydrofolate--homocysteine methyltransferase